MKIQAFIYDGFDELDVIGVYEPLRMAGFDVQLLTLRRQSVVVSAHGVRLVPDGILDIENKPDLLIVPGGGWVARASNGAWQEANDPDVLAMLASFHRGGVIMASVCTGAMLLAKAGLLNGRPATTNHSAVVELKEMGAKVLSNRVVDDGDIVTAGGVSSSLDLGLWLVERFTDIAKANDISERLEFVLRAPVWKANVQ